MAFGRLVQSRRTRTDAVRFFLDLPSFGERPPSLLVRYAGDGNDGYINGYFQTARQLGAGQASAQRTRVDRELEVPVYAEHVVTGWEDVYEDDPEKPGSVRPAEYTRGNVELLLMTLAKEVPDEFERLRRFCTTQANFRAPIAATEDVGKG